MNVVISEDQGDEIIDGAMKNPNIPHLYTNAVALAASNGDYCLVVLQNGQPTATLNMSFTVAKSLSVALGQMISNLELIMGQEIMTMDRIAIAMNSQDTANADN